MASTAEFFATRARGMMIVFVTIVTLLASAAFAQSPVSDDTYVSSAAPTTNNGNSPSLVVQKSSNGTTLIKPDLTQLQAAGVQGNAVSKAYLKLYTSAVTGQGTFDVYQVTSPWVEGTVTYNTMPSMTLVAAGGGSCPGVQCVNTTSKYVQVDITSLVQGWLNAPSTNLGLALKPNGTTISVTFESKESTTTSHAPEVDVVLNTTLSQIPGSISESQVTNLPTDIGNLNINVASKIPLSFMGATNGVATLDGTTHVPVSQLPGTLVYNNQANTYGAGNKQTFTSNGTAGLNLAGTALDPTTLAVGDLWFNSSIAPIGHLKFKAGTGPAETLAYLSDISGTLSAANSYTDSKVATEASARSAADAAEALARASGDAATLATANTYTDSSVLTEKNRATAAETSKANLVGGNIFTGGSQKLAAAAALYPSLNVPTSTTAPTTPAIGDLWLLNLDPHLNFRDMNNVTQMLAFTSDVTAANSSTLSSANSYTDSKVTAEATARSTADAAEALARASGDATTLATANTYTDSSVLTETNRATAAEASKANLVGGNIFIGGSQKLAAAAAAYPSLNVPNSTTAPTTPAIGDLWLLNLDPHLNFRDMNNVTQMLAFTSDVTAANSSTLASANAYTNTAVATEASARSTADAAEALARASGDATTLATANAYTDSSVLTETNRASAAEASKANLVGGNIFTGGSQKLAAAAALYPSLNVPNSTTAPTSPAIGDLWLLDQDPHLNFRDMNNVTQMLAFTSDVTAANSSTLSSANSYTDSKVTAEATARSTADAAEAVARANGDATTLASANTYTDSSVLTEKNRATTEEALKANLAGGNIFIGGSQKLAAAAAAYPSLNVPNSTTAPTTPAIGDLWLLNLDPHLNFRDMNNVTQMLAFTSDVTAANSSTLSSANSYTDSKVTAEATARSTADAAEAVARANGDATTLASANTYTGNAVSAEAVLRAAGDAAAVSSANAYTDGQVATINTSLTGKANLSGGNNFIGNQSITGNASITGNETVNGLLTLPVSAAGNNQPSHLFQLNATDNTGTAQSAQLQALADGSLSFRFGPTAGPIFQKLSIDNAGNIAFAGTQTFPGTVTSAQFASLGTAGTINSAGNPVDWTKLKNVPAGIAGGQVVTSVNTGAGLTGGPITSTGTISIASAGVTNAMLQNSSIGVTAGAGISVAGTSSLGGSFSIVNTGVLSFNTRTGAVTPQANDYSFAQLSGTDSATSHLVYDNQANTYGAGSKQTFKASATLAGLNLAGTSADPSPSLAAGDLWYNNSSGTNHPRFYDGTTTHSLAFADDSGANLTNLNASNLSSGTVPAARLSGTYAITVNGNASTATALAAVPSQCAASTFATGVAANGNANCTQPSAGNLSNGTSGSGAIVLATSPALAGTPTAPTAAAGTNTTQVATTAFVQSAASSAAATISFIKDTSAGALPNKSSAWVGNSLTGDGSGLEANFEFLVGQTPTFTKFYCRLSASQPQVVTFQLFDGSANPVSGASCQIAANATSNTATVSVALTAGGLYAVKATLASGTFGGGGPNAWWALGQ